jgi:hypothetical protein
VPADFASRATATNSSRRLNTQLPHNNGACDPNDLAPRKPRPPTL